MKILQILTIISIICLMKKTKSISDSDSEKYPYLNQLKKEIESRSEFFISKEKLKYILFIFHHPGEEIQESSILT